MVAKPRNTGQEWEPGDLTQTRASSPTPTPTTPATRSLLQPQVKPTVTAPTLKPVAKPVGPTTNIVGGRLKAPVRNVPKVDMTATQRVKKEAESIGQMALMFGPSLAMLGYGLLKDTVEETIESGAKVTPGTSYEATPETIDELAGSFKTSWSTNPFRRYKEAADAGYAVTPFVLEDLGNWSLVGYGLKLLGRSAGVASASQSTKAMAANNPAKAAKYANAANMANAFAEQAGRFATATDKLAAAPIVGSFKAVGMVGRELKTGAIGSRVLPESKWYGESAYRNSLEQIAKLREENPDIAPNDPRIVRLQRRAQRAWTTSNNLSLRSWIRRAVKYERNEADIIQRTLLDAIENPLYKEEFGPLTEHEQAAVVAVFNGTAGLIKWFADNTDMTAEQLSLLGRYDYLAKYSLTPEGARIAAAFVDPSSGMDPRQVERLQAVSEILVDASRQASQRAIEGYGRKAAMSEEYLVPTPLSQNLEQALLKLGNEELLDAWQGVKDSGVLDLEVNDPNRMQTLQAFVRALPDEYALDARMYPAPMRPLIAFYSRVRRGLEQEGMAAIEGRPWPPTDGTGLSPKTGRPGVFKATMEKLNKKLDSLAVAIVKKTEQIAKLEAQYAKNVEVVFKYKVTDMFVRGIEPAQIAAETKVPEARIMEILDPKKNKIAALYLKSQRLVAEAEAMRAELGVGLRMITVDSPYSDMARENMEAEYQRLVGEAEAIRDEMADERERLRQEALDAGVAVEEAIDGIGQANDELGDLEDQYEDAGLDPEDIFEDPELMERALEPLSDGARQVLENERDGLLKRVEELKAEEARLQGMPEEAATAEVPPMTREAFEERLNEEVKAGRLSGTVVNKILALFNEQPYQSITSKKSESLRNKGAFAQSKDAMRRLLVNEGPGGTLWWSDGYVLARVDDTPLLATIDGAGRWANVAGNITDTKVAGFTNQGGDVFNFTRLVEDTAKTATKKFTVSYQIGDVVIGTLPDGELVAFNKEYFQRFDDGSVEFFGSDPNKGFVVKRNGETIGLLMPNRIGALGLTDAFPSDSQIIDFLRNTKALVIDIPDKARARVNEIVKPPKAAVTPKTISSVTRLKNVQRDIGASEARLSQIDAELAADAEARLAPVEAAITRAEEAVRRVDEIAERDRQMFERHRGWANYYDDDNLQIPAEQFGVLVDEKNQLIDEYGELQRVRLNREQPDQWPEPENVNRFIDADDQFIASRQSEIESRLIDLERQIDEATAEPSEARLAPVEAVTTPTADPLVPRAGVVIPPELQSKLDKAKELYARNADETLDWSERKVRDELVELNNSLTLEEMNLLETPLDAVNEQVINAVRDRVGPTIKVYERSNGLEIVSNTNAGLLNRESSNGGTYLSFVVETGATNLIPLEYQVENIPFNKAFTVAALLRAIDQAIAELPEMYEGSAKKSGVSSLRAREIRIDEVADEGLNLPVSPSYLSARSLPRITYLSTLNQGQFKKVTSLQEMMDALQLLRDEYAKLEGAPGPRLTAAAQPAPQLTGPQTQIAPINATLFAEGGEYMVHAYNELMDIVNDPAALEMMPFAEDQAALLDRLFLDEEAPFTDQINLSELSDQELQLLDNFTSRVVDMIRVDETAIAEGAEPMYTDFAAGVEEALPQLEEFRQQIKTARNRETPAAVVQRVEAIRPDPAITNPAVRNAVYTSDVIDALAPRLAAKMDEANGVQARLTAFQEYMDVALQSIDTMLKAQNQARVRLTKAETAQEKRLKLIEKQTATVNRLVDQHEKVEEAIARGEAFDNFELLMSDLLSGDVPLSMALDADIPSYGVDTPEGILETVGPLYVPTGRVAQRSGATRLIEVRPGTEGFRQITAAHYRDGDRHTIFDIREIALRLGSDAAQMSRNETYRGLVAVFGKKATEFFDQETLEALYNDAYERARQFDPERIRFENPALFEQLLNDNVVEVTGGVGAYAPGNANPNVVFQLMVRELYGKAIREQMQFLNFQVIDPFREIDASVSDLDITHESMFVPMGFKENARRVTAPPNSRWSDRYIDMASKITQGFKTGTLVLSVTWQLGDLISALIIAQMTGVSVPTMIQRMKQIVDAEYEGGYDRSMWDPNVELPVPTRLGRALQESPVQDLSLAQAERERIMGLTPVEPKQPNVLMRPFRRVADVSYRVNETINRVARHAFYLELLEGELAKRGIDIETVIDDRSLLNDPTLRQIFFDTADTANKWLGDFANLDTAERRYVTPLIPFYSWTKHIHKVFMALGREHPQSIRWYLTIGAMYYNPEEDPMGLRTGLRIFGGIASTGFMNPLGDVLGGPVAQILTGQGFAAAGQTLGPVPRMLGGAAGLDLSRASVISRPVGTGVYGSTGNLEYGGTLSSPQDFLGFTIQNFPIAQRTLSALPALNRVLPGEPIPENIPGTRIALGPVARFQTGEARTQPGGVRRIEQPGGDLAAVGRLFSLPFIPYRSEQQIRDIELSARQRLRTLESIRRQRDILGPPG